MCYVYSVSFLYYQSLKYELMNATGKQLEFIKIIEEFAPIDFTGKTKQEASEYISKYKECIPIEGSQNMWAIINGY